MLTILGDVESHCCRSLRYLAVEGLGVAGGC
jgi:hypothetical protein